MSAQGTIKRYTLLIEKIGLGHFPSFQELQEFLDDHGFTISQRTLQRDIEQIRYEFGIEIVYNRSRNGYMIDKDNSVNLESFIKFLEIAGTGEMLADSLKEGKEVLDFISFENDGNLKGIEHLKNIVMAIKSRRKISFTHQNYLKETFKNHVICPYHLKEYQTRWYVYGNIEGTKTFRTFGIDRLTNVKVLTEKFKPDTRVNPAKLFDEVVGLNYDSSKIERVKLWVDPDQLKYLESLPLHKTQTVLEKNDEGAVVQISVRLNYELIQRILALGANVSVMEPIHFKNDVKRIIKEMLDLYS
jgi:predicted DNA-binding transcriptional regulator YafY